MLGRCQNVSNWFVEWNSQESSEKHEHDAKLAAGTHGKPLDFSHRQNYNDQVKHDVEGSGAPSIGVQVDTITMVLAIPALPSKADRNALQRGCCNEGDDI